jgi:hypothetical protein
MKMDKHGAWQFESLKAVDMYGKEVVLVKGGKW